MAVAVAVRGTFENHVKLVESQNTAGHVLPASEASFYVADLGVSVRGAFEDHVKLSLSLRMHQTGASRQDLLGLVRLVKELGMRLAGASFHAAPSVPIDAAAYVCGVQDAAEVFAHARELGLNPTVLDIGGAECFFQAHGEEGGLRVLAESGTLFFCSPFYLAVKVLARRKNATAFGQEPPTRIYINDGIYSSFMMRFIVNMTFSPIAVIRNGTWHGQKAGEESFKCSLWRRSRDSNDCINRECVLDQEVDIGDWLVSKDMGAYTTVCNTTFNGFISSNHTIYLEPSSADKASFKPVGI